MVLDLEGGRGDQATDALGFLGEGRRPSRVVVDDLDVVIGLVAESAQ